LRAGWIHRGVLLAVCALLAYLIYLLGQNSFAWWRAAIAAAYTLGPVLLVISSGAAKRHVAGLPRDAGDFSPVKLRWLNGLWPYQERARIRGHRYFLQSTWRCYISIVRQLDGHRLQHRLGTRSTLSAGIHFALLAVIVIRWTILHFIQFDPTMAPGNHCD